ncbi:hypothetical protein E9840_11185 [Tissierella creatinini]|nr:hypothetical protein E9840_11185 [Tissierella creatinini]TJX62896.1 hypothetical protein E8P77_16230 [Soehngenia saccharolytica]
MLDIKLDEQECPSGAKFNNQIVITQGFLETFKNAHLLAVNTIMKILDERVNSETGADYLQVAHFDNTKFWVIDDGSYVTFLLPEEY